MLTRSRTLFSALSILLLAATAAAAPPRAREPNSVYAERRAQLRAKLDGPVVLFGFTGRENSSPSYVFNQEESFYYVTGFNYEGAAVLIVPEPPAGQAAAGAREILFLQPRNISRERWDGPRIGPDDPGISDRTGFDTVKPFAELKDELERLGKTFTNFYTLLPRNENESGYPHARNWRTWLAQVLPRASLREVRPTLAAMRQIKSPSEIEMIIRATELSMDAHLEAMRMMRPGVYEYEVAARMEFIHKRGGCEGEAYAPIVGSGFFSTVLHYNDLGRKIEDGDVIVLDVGGQFSGYATDITRTLPASGKFTARQREIYEIVLGAQNAALAALKPGVLMGRGRAGDTNVVSLQQIAMDYMNAHGTDRNGKPLGQYFIHGLGHHVGLNVHDPSAGGPLQPGMVVTVEPGIYIPEENLGVRIEDMVLVTETGYKLLTQRLPRTVEEIEKVMADARCTPGNQLSVEEMDRLGISRMTLFYPPLARLATIQGTITLEAERRSSEMLFQVSAASGQPILREAAQNAVKEWVFQRESAVPARVILNFSVEGRPQDSPDQQICLDPRSGADTLRLDVKVHPARVESMSSH